MSYYNRVGEMDDRKGVSREVVVKGPVPDEISEWALCHLESPGEWELGKMTGGSRKGDETWTKNL